MIKDAGLRTKGLLMMGLPGENEASIRRSMKYVFSLPIDDFNLAKFTPFPGSPIYEKIHELGEFEEDWEKMDCMNFLFVTKGMTRERLEVLFQEFYRNHFQAAQGALGLCHHALALAGQLAALSGQLQPIHEVHQEHDAPPYG